MTSSGSKLSDDISPSPEISNLSTSGSLVLPSVCILSEDPSREEIFSPTISSSVSSSLEDPSSEEIFSPTISSSISSSSEDPSSEEICRPTISSSRASSVELSEL